MQPRHHYRGRKLQRGCSSRIRAPRRAESAVAHGACGAPRAIARAEARVASEPGPPTYVKPLIHKYAGAGASLPGGSRQEELSDRLARVARPAWGAVASTPAASGSYDLFGWDSTTGIVSVDADTAGRARVWRRVDDHVQLSEHRFPNWFLTTSLEL